MTDPSGPIATASDGGGAVVLGVVVRVQVSQRGVVGLAPTGPVLDAHHADHPRTRNKRLANGLSVLLPVAHDDAMRQDFGDRISAGCAGELLLQTSGQ